MPWDVVEKIELQIYNIKIPMASDFKNILLIFNKIKVTYFNKKVVHF